MSSETVLRAESLGKRYRVFDTPADRLAQLVAAPARSLLGIEPRSRCRETWALRNVDFEIRRGETVGVVGRNGSGKSTLLQLATGVLSPDEGRIETRGRIAALLELGTGFNPDLTGRENARINSALMGLTAAETEARLGAIAEFADIGPAIDMPVKTYSSGMHVRLAFAVMAHVDADILVVDEALAVGDAFFSQKCMRFLRDFQRRGTVFFVSHDTGAVASLCDRAILLENGTVRKIGGVREVIEEYLASLYQRTQDTAGVRRHGGMDRGAVPARHEFRDMRDAFINATALRNDVEVATRIPLLPGESDFGDGGARVESVRLLDSARRPLSWVVGGEDVVLEIRCRMERRVERPILGFLVKDRTGQNLFGDNTFLSHLFEPATAGRGQTVTAVFAFRMPRLPEGEYVVDAAVADGTQDAHVQMHWAFSALVLRSHCASVCSGLIGIPMREISLAVK